MACSLCLVACAAIAADYNDWKPILPEEVGGMEITDSQEGANVEQGGRSWSFLKQGYANAEDGSLSLSLIYGSDAPPIQQFKSMQQFSMETEEKTAKTLEIEGYSAYLELQKGDRDSYLVISPREDSIVVVETDTVDSEEELVSLADDVPLEQFAAAVEQE
ncbi:MAG: hypothetical protein K9L28_10235 [Synergistales bacterium]|nr:hypothetical protein [Synergistales bacterium]